MKSNPALANGPQLVTDVIEDIQRWHRQPEAEELPRTTKMPSKQSLAKPKANEAALVPPAREQKNKR